MEYRVFSEVLESIEQFEKRSIVNNYIFLIIFIVGSFLLYSVGNLEMSFYVSDILTAATLLIIIYSQTVPKGKVINNTATFVEISNDEITIETLPIKVLFWLNKPAKEFTIEIKKTRVLKAMYPVKKIYDLDNYVFSVVYEKQEFYIIPDFFDKELKESLTKLLRY